MDRLKTHDSGNNIRNVVFSNVDAKYLKTKIINEIEGVTLQYNVKQIW